MEQKYLIVKEVAELLRVKPHAIHERMRLGVFKLGVHYFRRKGRPPLFKRAALIEWIEEEQENPAKIETDRD